MRLGLTNETKHRRFVFLDAGIAANQGIHKKVVMQIIVGGGDFANNAFVRERVEFMIDAGNESDPRSRLKFDAFA